jgi:DnaJ-class molecular chaperone
MGMDVFGKNPKNEKGEYFRNNVWWWRPLADFVCNNYEDIAQHCEHWHSNDGDGLDAEKSQELGERILADVAIGIVAEYEKSYNAYLATLERRKCELCNGTGIRTDELGVKNGQPTKELSAEVAILVGRTHGYCNACSGIGTREDWAMSYPFNTQNVQNFAEFLVNCGGFKIC